MDVPAGMKNPTSGDYLSVVLNSIVARLRAHNSLFILQKLKLETTGNPLGHALSLRGAVNKHGEAIPITSLRGIFVSYSW